MLFGESLDMILKSRSKRSVSQALLRETSSHSRCFGFVSRSAVSVSGDILKFALHKVSKSSHLDLQYSRAASSDA